MLNEYLNYVLYALYLNELSAFVITVCNIETKFQYFHQLQQHSANFCQQTIRFVSHKKVGKIKNIFCTSNINFKIRSYLCGEGAFLILYLH